MYVNVDVYLKDNYSDVLLIAGNRTQVLDLVQLIDVTVNELIVLIRRAFVDRLHILTFNTMQTGVS